MRTAAETETHTDTRDHQTASDCLAAIADFGKRLFAASTAEEIAHATARAGYHLLHWDVCQIIYTEEGTELRPLLHERRAKGNKFLAVPVDSLHVSSALTELKERGAYTQSLHDGQSGTPATLLAKIEQFPVQIAAAPIGRGVRHAGQILLQRFGTAEFDPRELELLKAIANFCGDALLRARTEAEPHAPQNLVEERNLLRTLVDNIPDWLYIKDLDSRFVLSNKALAQSVGRHSPSDVIGKRDADFAPPELGAQYRSDELQVMSSGEPLVEHEELVVEASGKRVWVTTTKVPLRDEKGRVIGLVGLGHNPQPTPKRQDFKRGTAEETAAKAGVSVATVSRAFNGSPRVTEETRQRIFAVAREVGYYPNAAARSLSKGQTEVVSVILPAAIVTDEFQAALLAGLQGAVRRCGFDVLFSSVETEDEALARVDEIVSGRKSGAIAIEANLLSSEARRKLQEVPLPLVLMNHVPEQGEAMGRIISVGFDVRHGMRQAVRHLVALGHEQIAWFHAEKHSHQLELQSDGYRSGLSEHDLEYNKDFAVEVRETETTAMGSTEAQQLLSESATPPTAILCSSDRIAAGVVTGARTWGRLVPSALSVVGFGNASWSAAYLPPLTTVAQRGEELGTAAGQLLIAHSREPERPAENVLLPTRLIVRNSTGPVP